MDQQRAALNQMTIPQLKDVLRQRGLKVGGKKQELVDRILAQGVVVHSPRTVLPPLNPTVPYNPPPTTLPTVQFTGPVDAPVAVPRASPRAVSPRARKKIVKGRTLKADMEALTIPQLKSILKKRKLKVSGNKAELVERVLKDTRKRRPKAQAGVKAPRGANRRADLEALPIPQLKNILRARQQKVSGKKAELVERILSGEGIGTQKPRKAKK